MRHHPECKIKNKVEVQLENNMFCWKKSKMYVDCNQILSLLKLHFSSIRLNSTVYSIASLLFRCSIALNRRNAVCKRKMSPVWIFIITVINEWMWLCFNIQSQQSTWIFPTYINALFEVSRTLKNDFKKMTMN